MSIHMMTARDWQLIFTTLDNNKSMHQFAREYNISAATICRKYADYNKKKKMHKSKTLNSGDLNNDKRDNNNR